MGDNADPCGSPTSEDALSSPINPLIFRLTFLFFRKESINFNIFPLMPSLYNLTISPFFQTESNAFSKSMKRHMIVSFFLISDLEPCTSLFRYLTVFLPPIRKNLLDRGHEGFSTLSGFPILIATIVSTSFPM